MRNADSMIILMLLFLLAMGSPREGLFYDIDLETGNIIGCHEAETFCNKCESDSVSLSQAFH